MQHGLSMVTLVLLLQLSMAIDPVHRTNITVYHVNQATYGAAPVNMDTGDALGDMYFDFRSVDLPMECAKPSPSTQHDCENAEVTSDNLVITKLVLTVDNRFGEYGRCNVCVNGTDHHGHNNCTDGQYLCSCGERGKPLEECGAAVGQENVTEHFGLEGDCTDSDPNWRCWHVTDPRSPADSTFS
eukprot:TRINITY_DN3666_c0_g2_i3.p1 TRINITY_DN3666_c0_g2~~TRINITY_DN3666_c0_g2_i3.p1  ORF type:complete len:185 (-),score=41.19 TRINITY_DN3666_c0_g2_i3:674-1228(-)